VAPSVPATTTTWPSTVTWPAPWRVVYVSSHRSMRLAGTYTVRVMVLTLAASLARDNCVSGGTRSGQMLRAR